MTTLAPPLVNGAPVNGKAQVDDGVRRYRIARANAKRFHREEIGEVDPDHCFAHWLSLVGRKNRDGSYGDTHAIAKEYGRTLAYQFGDVLDGTGTRSKTAMSEAAGGPVGGYLVPPELRLELMEDVAEVAFFRRFAHIQPMKSATQDVPFPDPTTASGTAGVPSWFGNMKMTWTQEAAARTESEPKFGTLRLTAWALSGLVLGSVEFAQDAVGSEAWLRRLFANSLAWFEDYAFLQGNGVGKPLGIVNAGGTIQVSRNAGSTISLVDAAKMDGSLLPRSFASAFWLTSNTALIKIAQFAGWVPNAHYSLEQREKLRVAGLLNHKPLIVTDKLPAVGTLGDLVLVDPTLYVIGDREAIEVAVSDQYPTAYANYQAAWRIVDRVDGQPLFANKITSQDQSTTFAPFVALN